MDEVVEQALATEERMARPQRRGDRAGRRSWLQFSLLALILIGGLLALNIQQSLSSGALGQQRETALQVAEDQRHESELSSYISGISDMLLHDNLMSSKAGDEVRLVANARTHEVLHALDADRKAAVMRFLYTTRLINNDRRVIDMSEGDLRDAHLAGIDIRDTYLLGVDLTGADLRNANLSFATLIFADLSRADLSGTDLQGCDMHTVNLSGANLAGANLKGVVGLSNDQLAQAKSLTGATLPDGSKHS